MQTAVEAGADYISFVFAPSKRQVMLTEKLGSWLQAFQRGSKVGVFLYHHKEKSGANLSSCGLGPDTSTWTDGWPSCKTPTNDSRCSSGEGRDSSELVLIICSLMLL